MLLKLFILFSTANKLDHGFLFLAKHFAASRTKVVNFVRLKLNLSFFFKLTSRTVL